MILFGEERPGIPKQLTLDAGKNLEDELRSRRLTNVIEPIIALKQESSICYME